MANPKGRGWGEPIWLRQRGLRWHSLNGGRAALLRPGAVAPPATPPTAAAAPVSPTAPLAGAALARAGTTRAEPDCTAPTCRPRGQLSADNFIWDQTGVCLPHDFAGSMKGMQTARPASLRSSRPATDAGNKAGMPEGLWLLVHMLYGATPVGICLRLWGALCRRLTHPTELKTLPAARARAAWQRAPTDLTAHPAMW